MASVNIVELCAEGLQRLLELADDIDEGTATTPVPACPGWTVKDVYAHQAGAAADVLAGRLEGIATDPWTARQVEERAGNSFAEVVGELRDVGAKLTEALAALGDDADFRVLVDQWSHEQDVRGALKRPGAQDANVVRFLVPRMMGDFVRKWMKAGLPPAFVNARSGHWLMGAGEPEIELDTDDFELLRIFMGRRSRSQVMERWQGPEDIVVEVIDQLLVFKWAEQPIIEE